ncbi:MAG: hypothetical protein QXP36_08045 [Conexivisphaerales archaeon]
MNIVVNVSDKITNDPISGVTVQCGAVKGLTANDGNVTLNNVTGSSFTCTKPFYIEVVEPIKQDVTFYNVKMESYASLVPAPFSGIVQYFANLWYSGTTGQVIVIIAAILVVIVVLAIIRLIFGLL